jgi:hypothetical protein
MTPLKSFQKQLTEKAWKRIAHQCDYISTISIRRTSRSELMTKNIFSNRFKSTLTVGRSKASGDK